MVARRNEDAAQAAQYAAGRVSKTAATLSMLTNGLLRSRRKMPLMAWQESPWRGRFLRLTGRRAGWVRANDVDGVAR
jgi:hypothetical protein